MSDDPKNRTLADLLGIPRLGSTEFQIAWGKKETIHELFIQLGFTEDTEMRQSTPELDHRWFNLEDDWVEDCGILLYSTNSMWEFAAEPTATITLAYANPELAAEYITGWLLEHRINASMDPALDPTSGEEDDRVWFVTFGQDVASFDLRLIPFGDTEEDDV